MPQVGGQGCLSGLLLKISTEVGSTVERLEDPRDRGRDRGGGDARMFSMVEF
jgi:hypothetical protein